MKIFKILIFVLFTLLFVNSKAQTPFYECDFETSAGGFVNNSNNPNCDWKVVTGSTAAVVVDGVHKTGPTSAHSGNHYAYVDIYNKQPESGTRISFEKTFDLSSLNNPVISFWAHLYTDSQDDKPQIIVSVKRKNSFEFRDIFKSIELENIDDWQKINVCLSKSGFTQSNSSDLVIAIQFLCKTTPYANFAIDDIKIENFELDVKTTDARCFGEESGQIDIEVLGAGPSFKYSIDGGEEYTDYISDNKYTYENVLGGIYHVKVADLIGQCSATKDIKVNAPDSIKLEVKTADIKCFGDENGTITVLASNSIAPYTYSIGGRTGTFGSNNLFENLKGGPYTVVVKNANGCYSSEKNVVVGQDVKLAISSVEHTNVERCYGDKTAMVSIIAEYAKNGPIGYSVDDGATYYNSNIIYNLPAGKYKVRIRDKNLCEIKYPEFEITQPKQLVYNDFETVVTNVENCFGDSTGVIVASVKGGTEPYQYSINKQVTFQESEVFESLAANKYQIYVKDANECVVKSEAIEITQPTELKIREVLPFDVQTCYGENTGYIEIRGQGGTPSYQYSLDGINYQTSVTLPDLYAGWYKPYVKDRKGCIVRLEDSVFVDQPDQIELLEASAFGEIKCYGDKTATISALANGGTLPYTYTIKNWLSNNKTMSTKSFCRFTGLGSGDYVVQAKDANGCKTAIQNITITQPDPVEIISVKTDSVSCYLGQDGKIIIKAKGGTSPYLYGHSITGRNAYSNGENSTILGVPFGLYDVKVTDANYCFAVESVVEVFQPTSLSVSRVDVTDVSTCYGDSNGTITITTNNGGVGPYQYSIDNGESYQTPQTFENLPFGTRYLIKIKDSRNCEQAYDRAVTVNQPSQVKIQEQQFKNIEGCSGVANGEISLYVTGGNSPYSFSIDDGQSFTSIANQRFRFENLTAGSYPIVVKDRNNCGDKGSTIVISQPDVMKLESVETIDEDCYGQSIGQAIITISGGEPTQYNNPYYFVLEGDPSIYWNKGHFDGLEAGSYNVKAYDKFECSVSTSFTIKQPEALKIENVSHTDVNTCNGDRTASIEFSSTGGVSPITYTISSIHEEKENLTGKFENLPASSYSLLVRDANGCQDYSYLDISQPERIRFTRKLDKEILCYGDEGASFSVFAEGGTAPYFYSVDGGKTFPYTENVLENMPQGDYKITVKDANNCLADKIELLAVTQPSELNLSWQKFDINCSTSNDGQIIVSCSGGTKAYQYSIDGGNTFVDSPIFKNLLEGTYKIKVVDYHGCEIESDEMEIIRPENKAGFSVDVVEGCTPLKVVITQDHEGLTNYDLGDGHKVENCTGPYTYTYQNNTDKNITYRITAALEMLNMSGCRDTAYNQVTVFNKPIVDFRLDYDTVTYPSLNATFVNISRDVSEAFWDFGDGNTSNNIEEFSHEYPKCGSYDIKLVETNGRCSDSLQKTFVIASKKMFLNILSDVIEGCEPLKVTFEQSSVNVDSCQWFFGDSTYTGSNVDKVIHQFETPGQYVVTLVGYGDCESQVKTTKRINVFSKPSAGFLQNKDTLYAGQYLRLENNSKSSDFFFWDFGDGETSTEPEPIHKYEKSGDFNISLIVTAAEGSCADTSTVESAVCVINNPIVVFPNAFSPNDDGINDVFVPVHGELTKFEMQIFNRNGILVKKVTDVDQGWDGTNLKGVKCPPGVYAYKSTSVLRDNSFYLHHGWVMLIR